MDNDSGMKKIAIIPARGGSKRIPRKNIKEFLGKPIIAYSIEAAIKSRLFDEVMISTDDDEIANIGIKYGANIPFMRSKKNSDDFASTADVLIEVLEDFMKLGNEFDYFCCIYPTAPFITAKKLKDSYRLMIDKDVDSIIPVVKFSYPPQRSFVIKNGKLLYREPQYINSRSQELEPIYHDAGQFYWCKVDTFIKYKSLITYKTLPFVVSEMEIQDVDNEEDWKLAEIKYKKLSK